MFKIFGFGRKPAAATVNAGPAAEADAAVGPASVLPGNSRLHSNVQRELVRVVLKDTLRMHGIPAGWISGEVTVAPDKAGGEVLSVQLVVMKWNEALLRFAPAFERQLLLGLDRFDPQIDHSGYVVSWRFAPDCGCPFTQMPDPQFWTKASEPPAQGNDVSSGQATTSKPKFDLPPSDLDNLPSGFAPTEPSPLR